MNYDEMALVRIRRASFLLEKKNLRIETSETTCMYKRESFLLVGIVV